MAAILITMPSSLILSLLIQVFRTPSGIKSLISGIWL